MLLLATYFYVDAANDDDQEPLLIIFDEVNAKIAMPGGLSPIS